MRRFSEHVRSFARRRYRLSVRILIAPDDFKGTLSAAEAAAAIASGWKRTKPAADLIERPLSDGGPGFVEAIAHARGLAVQQTVVRHALGMHVQATWCADGSTAYVEAAQAVGLEFGRDVLRASSYGLGELLAAVRKTEVRRIVVGLGGTCVNDGGAGMLAALGAVATTNNGSPCPLDEGPGALRSIASIDLSAPVAVFDGIELIVATDVDVPLLGPRGATYGFAPQKGAIDLQLVELESAMQRLSDAVGRRADGKDAAVALGAGAAGGLGFALIRLGATRVPGIDTVWAESDIDLTGVDLILTGEGTLDWQSQRGKVVSGVAQRGMNAGIPVVALCGQVEMARRERTETGLAGAYGMVELVGEEAAFDRPAESLATLAERVARTWG